MVTKNTRESFRVRCICGEMLSEEQFVELVENALVKESYGLYCRLYADWNSSQPFFWDTCCWTVGDPMAPTQEDVIGALQYFTQNYLREKEKRYLSVDDLRAYVQFEVIFGQY